VKTIEHTQGITSIKYQKDAIFKECSMGVVPFTAHVTIVYKPNDMLVDFTDLDRYIEELAMQPTIIEQACADIFDVVSDGLAPNDLSVSIIASTTAHGEVEAKKEMWPNGLQ